ncbi:pyridoxal phosphate-dependent aminotransferase [Cellulosimicrobium arenosum]|uniref:Pyridoxal phosphate-dependent aminotransferase n=1 Tax=Cellulosimicrobium arenosum TaxID=2708133 RepID=A0A927IZA3_9MICO|nr:pyridoxal phosphate-dependent aminotransferase [Cellulosimicrobium arenosum]MBD8078052.1 pyridoxal phosphate-dependent aminotransferase [Cellulosimicrobium arenosum]
MTTHGDLPPGRWQAAARAAGLLRPDGTVAATIFAEMTDLARRTGAINLGQGAPDVDGPATVKHAAQRAIAEGHNQYPPGPGVLELRNAISDHQYRHYGLDADPDTEVLVTTGATEALAATILALAGPGDDVVTLEPFYDSYAASIALAGARHVTVPLVPGPHRFALDVDALRAAVTDRTRIILVNSPHNPTGTVLTLDELDAIASVARRHDALVVTDEVYEHLVYDDVEHVPIATLPGMRGRTLTISSAGKTFSFTGWKVGWLHGPAPLVTAVRTVKQFLTYASGAPFQPAIADALADDETPRALAHSLATRRDLLCSGLVEAGFQVVVPQGTYFVVADGAPLGFDDGVALCRELPDLAGVVGVPVAAFCTPGSATARALASRVRFTFVKREDVLRDAVGRLGRLGRERRG